MPLSTIFQIYRGGQFVLLVEETGVPRENHQPVTTHIKVFKPSIVFKDVLINFSSLSLKHVRSLKIPIGQTEAVNLRADNTSVK